MFLSGVQQISLSSTVCFYMCCMHMCLCVYSEQAVGVCFWGQSWMCLLHISCVSPEPLGCVKCAQKFSFLNHSWKEFLPCGFFEWEVVVELVYFTKTTSVTLFLYCKLTFFVVLTAGNQNESDCHRLGVEKWLKQCLHNWISSSCRKLRLHIWRSSFFKAQGFKTCIWQKYTCWVWNGRCSSDIQGHLRA